MTRTARFYLMAQLERMVASDEDIKAAIAELESRR